MERLRRNRSHQQFEDLVAQTPGLERLKDGMMDSLRQEGDERLVVVANRLPVTCCRDAGGSWQLQGRAQRAPAGGGQTPSPTPLPPHFQHPGQERPGLVLTQTWRKPNLAYLVSPDTPRLTPVGVSRNLAQPSSHQRCVGIAKCLQTTQHKAKDG
eukprot:364408-Chlamydomonas_euryale.AAC.1